jgi:hypothetical protein
VNPPDESADKLPRHTTPTWEVELLISGVAVFAMLQLPGWLNGRLLFLLPRFDDSWRGALVTLFAYAVGAAAILAATFAVHLLLRAYWIALVGVHSVHHEGIRWDRLRMGPIEREELQRRDGDFAAVIERADNRASIVFAAGVALAVLLIALTVLVVGMFAVEIVLVALLHWQAPPENFLVAALVIAIMPLLLAYVVDRRWGARLRNGSPLRRAVAAGFNLYARLGFVNRGGIMGVLSSHHGRRRVQAIAMVALAICLLGALLGQLAMRHPERFGNYAWFPHFDSASASVLDAAYYDDQRDPLRGSAVPFIQSAEVDGNYIRLTVPFRPAADTAAMRRDCAAIAKIEDVDVHAAAALRCLSAQHAVALDGKPLDGLRYAAGSDPRTDRPALVAMIDVRALAPGRHELSVARASPGSGESNSRDPWIIPFWR